MDSQNENKMTVIRTNVTEAGATVTLSSYAPVNTDSGARLKLQCALMAITLGLSSN
jgi:hypothetical protein